MVFFSLIPYLFHSYGQILKYLWLVLKHNESNPKTRRKTRGSTEFIIIYPVSCSCFCTSDFMNLNESKISYRICQMKNVKENDRENNVNINFGILKTLKTLYIDLWASISFLYFSKTHIVLILIVNRSLKVLQIAMINNSVFSPTRV